MAKVQVIMMLTIDGFLPPANDNLVQWIKTNKKGFMHWRKKGTVSLFPHYPLIDLILDKKKEDNPCIYFAEITNRDSLELFHGLSIYRLVDEIVLYRLPINREEGNDFPVDLPLKEWEVKKIKTYRNGICRTIYHKTTDQTLKQMYQNHSILYFSNNL